MKIIQFFDRAAERFPSREFLLDGATRITYAEARHESFRVAAVLRGLGVGVGEKVAIWSPNSIFACQGLLGLLRARCVLVALGATSRGREVARAIEATQTNVLLFSNVFQAEIAEVISACPGLKAAVCLDADLDGFCSLKASSHSVLGEINALDTEKNAIATISATGGTTGEPKGVMLSDSAWEFLVYSSSLHVGHDHPVKLLVSPLFQTAGIVGFLSDLVMGCTHILMNRFEPERVLRAIVDYKVTYVFLAPTAIGLLLDCKSVRSHDYSSLRYMIYGGAPMAPARIMEAMAVFGPVLTTGFAQTETGGPVTFFSPRDHDVARIAGLHRFSSCGRETLFSQIEIMNEDGGISCSGESGEVVVRTRHLMSGYYSKDVDLTEVASGSSFGWHKTGDIGRKDTDGFVYLLDRKTDLIITGGHNVYPTAIENVLVAQPGVRECAVVGVPDALMGESVRAVIEPVPGAKIDRRQILSACREQLSSKEVPLAIDIWDELPKSGSGKVLRRQVRDHYWIDQERKI